MSRLLPLALLLASLAPAGCGAMDDREQYSFTTEQLGGAPEPPRAWVLPQPGALLVSGNFQTCATPNLKSAVTRSGSTLRVLVRERACAAGGTGTWYNYEILWLGLGSQQSYTVRVEHQGEAGEADGVVLETAARTL